MKVNESVDSSFTEFVDEDVNLIKIGMVVDTWCGLNCLPHNTKSDEVEAPVGKVLNISIS